MEHGLTIITPTGGRPTSFWLCQRYIRRQSWKGPLQWIIIDDVSKPPKYAHTGMIETYIFPTPSWSSGQNTLARNLLAAIPEVKYDCVLFIEDDDWYSKEYFKQMATLLECADLVGERDSTYYHIPSRRYRVMDHSARASLCQTGIRATLLPELKRICETNIDLIDVHLWTVPARRILSDSRFCVSMKGLPGRAGIGIGHRPDNNSDGWKEDPQLKMLRFLIGDDVWLYRRFMENQEFETFHWRGQVRYRCSKTWESGEPCLYDTYDLETLREHLREPHNRTGKLAKPTPPRVSPIVSSNGDPIIVADLTSDPPPSLDAFQDFKFQKKEE